MKPSRINRIVRILTALQSGQHYNSNGLARLLGKSPRTVLRDLRNLQDAGIPCSYDREKHGYIIDPEFFLPPANLNAREALSLLLLIFKSYNQSPFKNSVLFAALKIENNLTNELKQYCNTSLQHISLESKPQAVMDLLDDRFAQLLKAILKKRIVNIHYYLPLKRKIIVTDLNPYHLRYDGFQWCVIGRSQLHEKICTFNINQIREMNILNKCFITDEGFDVNEYIGRAWSKTPEGRFYHIKLKFMPQIAHNVAEVQWHNTQKVIFEDDGSAIIEFYIDGLNEIIWWILGYGDNVQVLAPKILQKRIAEMAHNMLKNYEQK